MGTAETIIDLAASELNDVNHTSWPEADLLTYLSQGMKAVVLLRPEANPHTSLLPLVPGTRQTIPDDGYMLIDVVRNHNPTTMQYGRACTPASRQKFDQTTVGWHTETGPEARNFIYDSRNRKTFYIWPGVADGGPPCNLEIIYARIPTPVTSPADELPLDDIYEPVLLNYVCHRARSKDASIEGQNPEIAMMYLRQFETLLLGQAEETQADLSVRHQAAEVDRMALGG